MNYRIPGTGRDTDNFILIVGANDVTNYPMDELVRRYAWP